MHGMECNYVEGVDSEDYFDDNGDDEERTCAQALRAKRLWTISLFQFHCCRRRQRKSRQVGGDERRREIQAHVSTGASREAAVDN